MDIEKLVSTTARNLAYLIEKNGVDVATLCAATKLAVPTINTLRRGIGNPTLSTLIELANYFEISVGDITEKNLALQSSKKSAAQTVPFMKINEIDRFLDQTLPEVDTYTVEVDWPGSASCFAVLINNDSLNPQFSAGTVLIIAGGDKPLDKDIVLVKIGDQHPCFRKIFIDGADFLFTAVPLESDTTSHKYKDYKIIGVLLKAVKTISGR